MVSTLIIDDIAARRMSSLTLRCMSLHSRRLLVGEPFLGRACKLTTTLRTEQRVLLGEACVCMAELWWVISCIPAKSVSKLQSAATSSLLLRSARGSSWWWLVHPGDLIYLFHRHIRWLVIMICIRRQPSFIRATGFAREGRERDWLSAWNSGCLLDEIVSLAGW